MNLFISFFISSRYFFSLSKNFFNKFTSILSIIIMSCGISSVITVLSIMNGFENELKNNILKFIPHIFINNTNGNIKIVDIKKNNILSKYIEDISETIISDVIIKSNFAISIGSVSSEYIKKNEFKSYLTNQNSFNYLKPGHYNSIMGRELANQLGIKVGDTFELITMNFIKFPKLKIIPNKHLFLLTDTFSTNNNIDNYQILVDKEDLSNFLYYSRNYIKGFRIWLYDPLNIESCLKDFYALNFQVNSWKDSQKELLKAAKVEKYMMTLLFSLIVLVSIISLMVSISLFIIEKEKDIAIFKTLGISKWSIMLIFVFQGLLSGILSILLGMFLSIFTMNNTIGIVSIIKLFYSNFFLPYSVVFIQIVFVNCIFILCVLLSIIYPAWKATQLCPSKRLSYE
ncbi:MAG: FtsX-like permease family protein [Buchnera aphidicola (Nurudea shiraii)]